MVAGEGGHGGFELQQLDLTSSFVRRGLAAMTAVSGNEQQQRVQVDVMARGAHRDAP